MEKKICTKENPYVIAPRVAGVRWEHPDAVYQRDWDKGDYDTEEYLCPNCNLRFEVELPD